MKQSIKKVLAGFLLILTVLGLTACGSTNTSNDQAALSEEYCQSAMDILLDSYLQQLSIEDMEEIAAMDREDLQQQIDMMNNYGYNMPYTAEAFQSAFQSYLSSTEELGDFQSVKEYRGPDAQGSKGEETDYVAVVQYSNREMELTLTFDKKGIVQSVTMDPQYTTMEILGKAGMNTLLGMGTVFAVLIFLSFLIYCFKFIPAILAFFAALFAPIKGLFTRKNKKAEEQEIPDSVSSLAKPEHVSTKTKSLENDKELVAAITAAICAYSGSSEEGFKVRSIRRAVHKHGREHR